MQTEGASGIFVAIVAVIVGSIVLSGSALLVLREEVPSVTASPTPSETAAAQREGADLAAGAAATRTPTPPPTTTPTVSPTPTVTRTATPTPSPGVPYTVQSGDALDLIAAEFGVPSAAIVEENGLVPPYVLEVGQVLLIPVEE